MPKHRKSAMVSLLSESKIVQCIEPLRQQKVRKGKSCTMKKKKIDKWNYITRTMPHVVLTDIMKQYTNNKDKAHNTKSVENQQIVEDIDKRIDDNIFSDATNKKKCSKESKRDSNDFSCFDASEQTNENNILCSDDSDKTEYAVDKQNELLKENFNVYHQNYNENMYNTRYKLSKQSVSNLQKNHNNREHSDSTTDKEDSSSDYCPSEQNSISTERDNDDTLPNAINKEKRANGSKRNSKNSSGLEISEQVNESGVFCPDDVNLKVDPSEGPKGGNKKNCCFYCRKMQSKIARHLGTVHRNEPDVKKFLDLPPNNLERKRIIETIRRNGNFTYNTNSNVNEGKLNVVRRPRQNKPKEAKDYTACAKCKGFFAKSNIRRHFNNCTGYSSKQQRSVMVMGRAIIGRVHPIAEETLRNVILPSCLEDEITRVFRYDDLIIRFGNRLCRKYRKVYQYKLIRSHLRYLGRYLKTIKEINSEISDMQSTFHPAYYEDCIRTVNMMSKFNNSTNTYEITTTPQLMGTLLKKLGNLLIFISIQKKDYETKKNVEEFLTLLIDDYSTSVNKAALEAQEENKRSKRTELPSMDDIAKLNNYLDKKCKTLCETLKETFCFNNWLELAKVTLTSIQLFNRRRAGEIEHLLVKDFENYERLSEGIDKSFFQTLSGRAREIANEYKYVRFTIRGKLMRTVTVLLSPQLLKCVEIILKYRENACIPKTNTFLFGIPGYNKKCPKFLNACELIRRFSTECGAERPWTLRGTNLRKHVATISLALDLSENDVSDLANHMGHAITIHKEIYRQRIVSRDVRLSQVLQKAQGDNNDDSDEINDDENCEYLVENSSREIVTESSANTSNSLSLNIKKTHSSAKKRNIVHENGKHSVSNKSLSDESSLSDAESHNVTNNNNKSVDMKSSCKGAKKRNTPPFGRTKRVRWTYEEKQIIMKYFSDYTKKAGSLPSIRIIQEVIAKHPCLQNRSASVVKTWINNQQRKNGVLGKL